MDPIEPQVQFVITSFAVEFHVSKIIPGQPIPDGQVVINMPQNLWQTDLTSLIPGIIAQAEAMDKAHAAS